MLWISMLRGINLGGHNKISMPVLARLFETLGLSGVKTYLQSGNVLFDSDGKSSEEISALIETGIMNAFGYDVQVFLRTPADFKRILVNNPFVHGRNEEPSKLHVTFLYRLPSQSDWDKLGPAIQDSDEFAGGQQEVFLFCPNGYGRTKLSNSFFERKLGQPATTRNWKTVNALYELVKEEYLQ
jgi:uncharacterized protein (DUF1697 family)